MTDEEYKEENGTESEENENRCYNDMCDGTVNHDDRKKCINPECKQSGCKKCLKDLGDLEFVCRDQECLEYAASKGYMDVCEDCISCAPDLARKKKEDQYRHASCSKPPFIPSRISTHLDNPFFCGAIRIYTGDFCESCIKIPY